MISQRLTSQTARSFAGGRVCPDDHLDLEHPKETAFQLAENEMKETGATCGLGVVGDPRTGQTIVAFIHPGGTMDWEFGRAGKDERMQMRTAVVTLENLRRYLIDFQPA